MAQSAATIGAALPHLAGIGRASVKAAAGSPLPHVGCAGGSAPAGKDGDEQSVFVRFMVESFGAPFEPWAFVRVTAIYYGSYAMQVCTCWLAAKSHRHLLLSITLSSLVVPNLLHALNTFYVLTIVDKKHTMRSRVKQTTMCIANVHRAWTAYHFLKGEAPMWNLVFKEQLGHLSFGTLPLTTINLLEIYRGSMPRLDEAYLSLSTLLMLLAAGFNSTTIHRLGGPPGNMQKYRFWDLERRPLLHIFAVLVIDMSQVLYRAILLGILGALVGLSQMVLAVGAYACACMALVFVGMSMVHHDSGALVLSLTIGLENMLFDNMWLEPVPVVSFYVQLAFFLRLVQAVGCIAVLVWHWDLLVRAWHNLIIRGFMLLGAASFSVYVAVYPWYVYWICRSRLGEVLVTRDEFVLKMVEKRKTKQAELCEKRSSLQSESRTSLQSKSAAGASADPSSLDAPKLTVSDCALVIEAEFVQSCQEDDFN